MDILNKLKQLQEDERLFISINKELSNAIKLYDIKFTSYDNLFMSYINNTIEEANKINIDNFLDRYTKCALQRELLIEKILKNCLGNDFEFFRKENFKYIIDYSINQLIIMKGDK